MKYTVFDDFFAVLGNKQRVRIPQLLDAQGSRTVTEISALLGIEQSAVSHNMKRLLLCHFVDMEPKGKERVYSINKQTVQPLFRIIDRHVQNYCANGCDHWE
jgi:DNA-binding transcriptional ArsR family regulator